MLLRGLFAAISHKITSTLEGIFYRWGLLVVRHPWLVILFSLLLCGALSGGLLFWHQETDQELLWTPYGSPFIDQKEWIAKTFPRDRRFENLIAVGENVLTADTIRYLMKVDEVVRGYKSPSNKTFDDLCLRPPGPTGSDPKSCQILGILAIFNQIPGINPSTLTDQEVIDFINFALTECDGDPSLCSRGDILASLSGYKFDMADGRLISATGSLNIWLLRDNSSDPLSGDPDAVEWEKGFIEYAIENPPDGKPEGIEIFGLAERSYDDEINFVVNSNLGLLMAGFALLFVYISVVLGNFNWIEQRVFLSVAGMLVIGLALGASFGLCFYIGLSINDVCPVIPFLLLGIGVDDMFVIIQCMDNLDDDLDPKEKVAQAMKHAGVAITVTSFTDAAAFFIGASTSMPILRAFCFFAGTGVIFLYIFACSYFVACLVLDERRRASQLASRPGWKPSAWTRAAPCHKAFQKVSPILLSIPVSILVIITALGLAAGGAYGLSQIENDYDSIWYMRHESYQYQYYSTLAERFSGQGERVEVYIGEVDLEEKETQDTLITMVEMLKKNKYIRSASVDFWFSAFKESDQAEEDGTFFKQLGSFLKKQTRYLQDLRLNVTSENLWDALGQGTFSVLASRAKFQHEALENTTIKNLAMDSVKLSMEGLDLPSSRFGHPVAYTFMYVQWEANRIIGKQLVRNMGLAFAVIALVSLLLIADPIVSLLVFICVALSVLEIIGGAYFMGLTIEIVTSIVLILSVGLALDYAAHIGVTYVVTKGRNRRERAQASVSSMGTAVAHGGVSTLLAFILVAFSNSYVYLTFFKMFLCVVVFGLFHGILLLPVLLSLIGSHSEHDEEPFEDNKVETDKRNWPSDVLENSIDDKTKL